MSIGTYAQSQAELIKRNDYIDPALYKEYDVAACATRAARASSPA